MTPNNYNDQFTEWLESQISATNVARIRFGPYSASSYSYECYQGCLDKYKELAPAWIPGDQPPPPNPNDTHYSPEAKASKRVLVLMKDREWFGRYLNGINSWSIEGASGDLEVQGWMPLPSPPINKEQ